MKLEAQYFVAGKLILKQALSQPGYVYRRELRVAAMKVQVLPRFLLEGPGRNQ